MLFRICHFLAVVALLHGGCRSTQNDRLPATAVDNPDPIFGSTTRPADSKSGNKDLASSATTQTQTREDRIGPLSVPTPSKDNPDAPPNPGIPPGTAALTKQVKQPISVAAVDTTIQPVQNSLGTSNPELLQNYRQKLTPFGLAGLRTKPLESGVWEAIAHFPLPDDPSQLRRIETQGVTEADALQAILEQIEKR